MQSTKSQTVTNFFTALFFTVLGLMLGVVSQAGAEEYSYDSRAGETNYMLQCQGCHKATGTGSEGSTPSLTDHGIEMLLTERGRQYYVSVPGSSQSPLSDRRLADVLNYITTTILEAHKKNREVPLFDTSEVAKYRNIKMKDVAKERASIVSSIESRAQE